MWTSGSESRINHRRTLTMNHLSTDTFHPSVFYYTSTLRVAYPSCSSPYLNVCLLQVLHMVFEFKRVRLRSALRICDAVTSKDDTAAWLYIWKSTGIEINTMWLIIVNINRIVFFPARTCQHYRWKAKIEIIGKGVFEEWVAAHQ